MRVEVSGFGIQRRRDVRKSHHGRRLRVCEGARVLIGPLSTANFWAGAVPRSILGRARRGSAPSRLASEGPRFRVRFLVGGRVTGLPTNSGAGAHFLGYRGGVSTRDGTSIQGLFDLLGRFRRRWPGRGWSWDSRFSCVSSSFSAELEQEARAAIAQTFALQFTQRSLRTAPPRVVEIAETTGGLRPDQLLVLTEDFGGHEGFGLWWPWGDDVTISFRVGLVGPSATQYEEELREILGAAW